MKNAFWGGIAAGMMVGIGGSVYLSCTNKVVGAVLFSVALICICILGFYLYTGKIGLFMETPSKKTIPLLAIGFGGNAIGAALTGIATAYVKPALITVAQASCNAKLENGNIKGMIAAIFCGVLMYTAVKTYQAKGTLLGIIFCIPTFILSGFEHSVADVYYFTVALMGGNFSLSLLLSSIVFIIFAIVGNTLGGWLVPILNRLGKENKEP